MGIVLARKRREVIPADPKVMSEIPAFELTDEISNITEEDIRNCQFMMTEESIRDIQVVLTTNLPR